MPIERRRKPSVADQFAFGESVPVAERGFLRVTRGQDARRERPRDGIGYPGLPTAAPEANNEKSAAIVSQVAFAELTTPGTPAPGWVPAPTR
jgi:hypothetical protein